jgi:5'-deoxynucleotidase YfbR-like HD superfamily hydrolase
VIRGWTQEGYLAALRFAAEAHGAQTFPGTTLPYLLHVALVAMEVIAALQAEIEHDQELAVQCALLHDVVEDTHVSLGQVRKAFGDAVANGVCALSKDKALPKDAQLGDSLERIRRQPREIAMVKLADRITNLQPPPSHWTQEKAETYRVEAAEILRQLEGASAFLAARLSAKIEAYRAFGAGAAATAAGAPPRRWLLYEDRTGPHRHGLAPGEWVVGRARDCDVVIDDFGLSLHHAKFVVEEHTVRVRDLKSKGGTQVNAVPITEVALARGDTVLLGHFPVRFMEGPLESAQAAAPVAETTATSVRPEARRALLDQIADIAGRAANACQEQTRLGELKDTYLGLMYLITTLEGECGVALPRDELNRLNTVGELADLIERSRRERGGST